MTEDQIKDVVVSTFGIDSPAAEIDSDEPLWGNGSRFGLDSIDSLRLISAVREHNSFDIGGLAPGSFRSVSAIAEFLSGSVAATHD